MLDLCINISNVKFTSTLGQNLSDSKELNYSWKIYVTYLKRHNATIVILRKNPQNGAASIASAKNP